RPRRSRPLTRGALPGGAPPGSRRRALDPRARGRVGARPGADRGGRGLGGRGPRRRPGYPDEAVRGRALLAQVAVLPGPRRRPGLRQLPRVRGRAAPDRREHGVVLGRLPPGPHRSPSGHGVAAPGRPGRAPGLPEAFIIVDEYDVL